MIECGKVLLVKDHTGQQLPELVCSLPHGHDGNHQDRCGAVWMNTREVLAAMRPVPIHYRQ